jgi:hypothetical protein
MKTMTPEQLQVAIDSIVRVWYKQGLDIRGADLGKFLIEVTNEIERRIFAETK